MFSETDHLMKGRNIVLGYEVFSASGVSIAQVTAPGAMMDVTLRDGGAGIKATLIAGGTGHFEISGALHLPFGVVRQNCAQHTVHLADGWRLRRGHLNLHISL